MTKVCTVTNIHDMRYARQRLYLSFSVRLLCKGSDTSIEADDFNSKKYSLTIDDTTYNNIYVVDETYSTLPKFENFTINNTCPQFNGTTYNAASSFIFKSYSSVSGASSRKIIYSNTTYGSLNANNFALINDKFTILRNNLYTALEDYYPYYFKSTHTTYESEIIYGGIAINVANNYYVLVVKSEESFNYLYWYDVTSDVLLEDTEYKVETPAVITAHVLHNAIRYDKNSTNTNKHLVDLPVVGKSSTSDEDNLDDLNSIDEFKAQYKDSLKTPAEYYSSTSSSSSIVNTYDDYDRQTIGSSTADTPVYFWVNTLRNWCTFVHVSDYKDGDILRDSTRVHLYGSGQSTQYINRAWKLCVWNGINGWDDFNYVCQQNNMYERNCKKGDWTYIDPETAKTVKFTVSADSLYYDLSDFEFISNFRIDHIENSSSAVTSTADALTVNASAANSFVLIARGIILTDDYNYACMDNSTMQPIRVKTIENCYHKDTGDDEDRWNVEQIPSALGCPMIWRLPSGELFLAIDWQIDGGLKRNESTKIFNFTTKMTSFINSCAKAFFTSGDDKTIDDWKTFTYGADETEEVASNYLQTDDSETLIAELTPQLDVVENTNTVNLALASNRSRVSTDVNTITINTLTKW